VLALNALFHPGEDLQLFVTDFAQLCLCTPHRNNLLKEFSPEQQNRVCPVAEHSWFSRQPVGLLAAAWQTDRL
jgi:hypothetical protein